MTHRSLAALDSASLTQELTAGREVIARHIPQTTDFLAYPYGSWNQTVHDAARDAGYRAAFALDDRPAGPADSTWALPRLCIPANLSVTSLAVWLVHIRLSRW
jgi:peptidoglycan/xylan/chitin deacetylase (PgdA/CDA1 family)